MVGDQSRRIKRKQIQTLRRLNLGPLLGAIRKGWGGTYREWCAGKPLHWNGPCRLSGGWVEGPYHRHGISGEAGMWPVRDKWAQPRAVAVGPQGNIHQGPAQAAWGGG